MKRWKPHWRRLRFFLIRGLLSPAAFLPRRFGLSCFGWLGTAAYHLLRQPRRRILANARLIFPQWGERERHRFARVVLRNVARNGFDFFRLRRYSLERIERLVAIEGRGHLDQAHRRGRGVVCLSAHLGCWELIPFRVRALGYPAAVVYRRLADPALDAFVRDRRRRFGIETFERDRDARGMLRALRRGTLLGILVDQHTRVDSVRVPFFGRPAWTPTGAVKLALRTGVPMVPLVISMRPDGTHLLRIGPEIPLQRPDPGSDPLVRERLILENTARSNDVLSRMILESADQWVWFHHRWREE